jgi:NTE family protein
MKIGLALSGGGFRAAFFHLGVMLRLEELGLLDKVEFLSSVSGGSIVAAYFSLNKTKKISEIITDFKSVTRSNIRNKFLLRSAIHFPLRFFLRKSRTYDLVTLLDKRLFKSKTLGDLPTKPHLIINATNLGTGKNWKFSKMQMGDYLFGFTDGSDFSIAEAVAASACFPFLFAPLPVKFQSYSFNKREAEYGEYKKHIYRNRAIQLVDGGVYDNLGINSLLSNETTHYIVSDASGAIDSNWSGFFSRPNRITNIIMSQQYSLRRKLLLHQRGLSSIIDYLEDANLLEEVESSLEQSNFVLSPQNKRDKWDFLLQHIKEISYFKMDTRFQSNPFTVPEHIALLLANIRTDLDTFSDLEMDLLIYHGYCLVGNSIRERCPSLREQCRVDIESQAWVQNFPPNRENEIAMELRSSHKNLRFL